jgi:zinc protease
MPDKSQADIALGFKAIPRRHADFYALSQATLVVGGFGLMGRLGANVRDRQGLAYGISARMSETFGDGPWVVHAGVSPAHVERAVASILDELRHLQDEPVTDPELADVQSYLVGVLPVRLETNDGVAATLNHIEVHGLGDDYLDRYPDLVRSVTREAVQRAAQEHLTTDRYSLALAGPPTRAEPLP